jgi:hypothetical protein
VASFNFNATRRFAQVVQEFFFSPRYWSAVGCIEVLNGPRTIMGILARIGIVAAVLGPAACGAAAPAGWQTYADPRLGYSISYPQAWKLEPNFVSVSLGPDHEIKGIAFAIPEGLTLGTNLSSSNTEISVESIAGANCGPPQFLDPARNIHKLSADGRKYSVATSEDAGAGNRYETMLFVVDGTSPCIAVRYLIHSTNIANYDPGTIKPFDRAKLIKQFDDIRATLKLSR